MKRVLGRSIAAVWAAIFAMNGWAYEINVHETMTDNAFNSLYSDPNAQLFGRLGITADQAFAQQFSGEKKALDWIKDGSKSEDSIPRPAYHFYDPISGKGLNGNAVSSALCPNSVCTPAPDWALNTDANNPNELYSIPGARESFYNALTTTDSIIRSAHWATTFRAMGQIVHLIQDMAQPQHVRNDLHFSLGEVSDGILRNFSRYERVTRDQAGALTYRGYNGDNPVKLSTWRKYWTEQGGKGIAQFTNRYFISQGTNFKSAGEPGYYEFPAVLETQEVPATVNPTDYRGNPILDPNGVPYTNIQIQYLSIDFTDSYTGLPGVNPKLATKSFFDFVHAQNTGTSVYSMDNAVYNTAAEILVPRAVGYSAGLIEYFFRGRLELTLPSDGAYGIVDHSQVTQNDPLNGFVGFSRLKVKVKNVTPNEDMVGGKLVAVVKFHRNGCYRTDLTGEFDEQHINPEGEYYIPNCTNYRTPLEEMVVSDPVQGVSLPSGTTQQHVFTFTNQQIPINARDIKLQIVYRGNLGQEEDAVAVETKDISEPTYLAVLNSTDYFVWQGQFYTRDNAPAGVPLDNPTTQPVSRHFRLYLDPNTPIETPTATVLNLAPAHYARFAVLSEIPTYYARVLIYRPEDNALVAGMGGAGWTAAQNQEDEQVNVFSPLGVFRSMRYFSLMWYFRSVDGTEPVDESGVTEAAHTTPDQATALNF